MKTPIRSAEMSAVVESTAKGENHESSGSMEPARASFEATLASATPAKSRSAPTWPMIITFCRRAESSVPRMQIAVITTMIATARLTTAPFEAAAPSQPKSRYV
jgi:hypothetical protein